MDPMGIVTGPVRPGDGITPAVALVDPKFPHNVGAAVRAASCHGVRQVWFSGDRVRLDGAKRQRLPREERMRGYQEVEIRQADYFFDAFAGVDRDGGAVPVAVELRRNAESLIDFEHPERALYVFGPEDGSLDRAVLARCHRFLVIPTRHCTNLSAAVCTVLYDRHAKRVQAGLEPRNSVVSGTSDLNGPFSPNTLSNPNSPSNPSNPDTPSNCSGFDEPDSMAPATGLTWPH
jgi:tRNA(Leu) C34 or U34 (ribose-2'-O)-methylase TrmL